MTTYKITNENFARTAPVFAGQAFHRPDGTNHREIKFVSPGAKKYVLDMLKQHNIEITKIEKAVS